MRAVDTNLVLRLLVRDDAAQVSAAETFVEKGGWVSHLVLAETLWVLDAVYERTPAQITKAIDLLLNHENLTLQDADVVALALEHFRARPSLGFSRGGRRPQMKKKSTYCVLSCTLFMIGGVARAASPDAWEAHYKKVTSRCVEASSLGDARPAGDPVDFDDQVGYTAIIIQGR